ncbi:MAG: phosphotransferase [Devosia sp.]|nr:phosphotransferase [Devosia sp.]
MVEEIALSGGRMTAGVVRIGDTVRRPISGDRSEIHALLRYLENFGCTATPRFLGIDEAGREILSYLPGDVPPDLGHYDEPVLRAAGALLRSFHDASSGFPAVGDAGAEVMCHNDWGPPNAVFSDGFPVGIIDFDTVRPGLRLWDLGYSAASWIDLGDPSYTGAEQVRRLSAFADGYARPDCSVEVIAAFCLARRAALATVGRTRGDLALAEWSEASLRWATEHMTEQLLPTGMLP